MKFKWGCGMYYLYIFLLLILQSFDLLAAFHLELFQATFFNVV